MTRHQELGPNWITAFSSDVSPAATVGAGRERRRSISRRPRTLMRRFAAPSATVPAVAPFAPVVRAGARGRRHRQAATHVMPQGLFHDVLARERRRAERYERASSLLLVGVGRGVAGPSAELESWWPSVLDALAASTGGLAVLGWFESAAVLGAVGPEIPGVDTAVVLRQQLALRLRPDIAAGLTIRVQPCAAEQGDEYTAGPESGPVRGAVLAPARPARDSVKRVLDVVGSLMLLVITMPIFVAIAALLKLTSPGPVFFRQRRVGQLAAPFTMLKFRTMRVNADQALHQEFVTKFIKSGAQLHPVGRKAIFKLTKDPRVTPLGRLLRKSSLDELPQLWNVLRGEMSLVGPRPPLPYEVDQYDRWHRRRVLEAKPGITGLWQVHGRSRTTFDEMVRLDLQYARNHSLWMDLRILLATPRAVISGKGAA